MTETSDTRWFRIVVSLATGFFAGIFTANAIYYNRIRTGDRSCQAISQNEANVLFWINLILAIIAFIIFIWALWRLIFGKEERTNIQQKYLNSANLSDLGSNVYGNISNLGSSAYSAASDLGSSAYGALVSEAGLLPAAAVVA